MYIKKHKKIHILFIYVGDSGITLIVCLSAFNSFPEYEYEYKYIFHRVQNLDSIVRVADRELPVVNTRGDVLFNSWKGIFNGQGGFFSQAPRIYSFSGKNVLTDPLW